MRNYISESAGIIIVNKQIISYVYQRMMKRKISILTLTVLFFTSTTALPLTLHYCEMMKSTSLEVCEMHKEDVIKTSCCEEENIADVYYSNRFEQCCSDFLVDSSVKDNFVISKTDLVYKVQMPVILFINLNFNLTNLYLINFTTDTSPPPLVDNHLYLINSILLI